MSDVVAIQGLCRKFGEKTALKNVSLSLKQGMVLGLIGENGAGKTTLIKHILGLYRAQQGSVRVFGRDPATNPEAVLGQIGYLAEEDCLPSWMRIHELQRYYKAFYPGWDQSYAECLLKEFALTAREKISELSKGQRARVGLMAALAYRPGLLVLDEPSSGLDPIVRREILSTIIRALAEDNRSVLFSSHLLGEIEQVADEVAMIRRGEILFCDTLDGVKAAHRKIVVAFDGPREGPPEIAGAQGWEGGGREWTCKFEGETGSLEAGAALVGARVVDEQWLTLDEIFVSRSIEATANV